MRFEVLGFAGAAPLQGACPSYVVATDATTVLLDCGPGTLERVWRRALLGRIDAIVVSHMHADHVLDLVPFSGAVVREHLGGRRIALHVPAANGPDVLARLDAAFAREPRATTRFHETFDVTTYDATDRLTIGDLELTFAPTAHPPPCFAARITDGDAVVVYGADGSASDDLAALAADADLLVLEATFATDEAAAAEYGHMTATQAGALAARAGARRLLLTHLIAGVPEDELLEQAGEAFPGPVDLAREGYELAL